MKEFLATLAVVTLMAVGANVWRAGLLHASPEPRIALVIGNADYGPEIGRLRNPVNDARLMDKTLRDVGFQVVRLENANQRQMKEAIIAFGRRLDAAGPTAVGLFYFAGHGFQTRGRNWLVPTGAVVSSEAAAEYETVSADYVLEEMANARIQLNIMVLDACRNNPFTRRFRSAQRGLAPVFAPRNTVIGYATAAGEVADDGAGANSPYASALAAEISLGSDPLEILMRKVTARVESATSNAQSPYVNQSLSREFRFRQPGELSATTKPSAPGPSAGSAPMTAEEFELEAWRRLGSNPSQAQLEAFLKSFPNGRYAGNAGAKLAELKQQAAKPPVQTPMGPQPQPSEPPVGAGVQSGFRDCPECPEMVIVPAGKFDMGSGRSEKGRNDDERPRHEVTFARSFAVGRFEVTRGQYARFVSATGRVANDGCFGLSGTVWKKQASWTWQSPGFPQSDDHPVACVNWDDAQAYVNWLSSVTGMRYRLPSEAEWEYAARGTSRSRFIWGDDPTAACAYANVADQAAARELQANWTYLSCDDRAVFTSASGRYRPNGFGLYDVIGNAWEWTQDCYHKTYTGAPADGNAWESGDCARRVIRGGSWFNFDWELRLAFRGLSFPSMRVSHYGFRVVRAL